MAKAKGKTKMRRQRQVRHLARLRLLNPPDEPTGKGALEVLNVHGVLTSLAKLSDLKVRLAVAGTPQPGPAEKAWLDVVNELDLSDQLAVLELSARFGPSPAEAGQRILGREAAAKALVSEIREQAVALGADPEEVDGYYDGARGEFTFIVGDSNTTLEYLPKLTDEVVGDLLADLGDNDG